MWKGEAESFCEGNEVDVRVDSKEGKMAGVCNVTGAVMDGVMRKVNVWLMGRGPRLESDGHEWEIN